MMNETAAAAGMGRETVARTRQALIDRIRSLASNVVLQLYRCPHCSVIYAEGAGSCIHCKQPLEAL